MGGGRIDVSLCCGSQHIRDFRSVLAGFSTHDATRDTNLQAWLLLAPNDGQLQILVDVAKRAVQSTELSQGSQCIKIYLIDP